MAGLPRMTVYRRVRRAVQNDLNEILSAGKESTCSVGSLSSKDAEVMAATESFPLPSYALCCSSLTTSSEILEFANGIEDVDVASSSSFDEDVLCWHKNGTQQCIAGDETLFQGQEPNSAAFSQNLVQCTARDETLLQGQEFNTAAFRQSLHQWSVERDVPHVAVTQLLGVLRSHSCFSSLPKSARTLLSTPRSADAVKCMGSGQYCHFGLSESIEAALRNVAVPDTVMLHVNVDGLPLTKSTRDQFWPILCRAANCEGSKPFPIGIYYGQCKALDHNAFLQQFVSDLKVALQQGITIGNKVIRVELAAIICDAPAKSYILGIKGHSGYFSCPKCTTEGDYKRERVCFPEIDAPLRTDASFRNAEQEEHHNTDTILRELPIDLIQQVPLDYMHLSCLGVVRKLLLLWIKGAKRYRIGKKSRDAVSAASTDIRRYVPSEMSRKPRSLSDVERWKASEFRFLLLYSGPVVLKSRISNRLVDNFMVLHAAMSMLCSPSSLTQLLEYAQKLLVHFVKVFTAIYGDHAVSLNVHCLVHVADDARVHGSVHGYSAFPFENYMPRLKKYVRKPEKPLEQLYNRVMEERALSKHTCPRTHSIPEAGKLAMRHENGPLPFGCVGPQYKSWRFSADVTIKANERDCTCMLKDKSIVKVVNFAVCAVSHQPVLIGQRYTSLEDLYTYPCHSSLINIFLVSKLSNLHFWPLSDVVAKCVRLPFGKKYAVFPMRHLQ